MLKRSLLLIVLSAAAAIGGHAQDLWKGHQPTLTPQQSGTTQLLIAVVRSTPESSGQPGPAVRTWLRPMAVRPGNPQSCREPKAYNSAMSKA